MIQNSKNWDDIVVGNIVEYDHIARHKDTSDDDDLGYGIVVKIVTKNLKFLNNGKQKIIYVMWAKEQIAANRFQYSFNNGLVEMWDYLKIVC